MFKPKNTEEEIFLILYRLSRHIRKHTVTMSDPDEPSTLQLGAMFVVSTGKNTMKEIADELGITMPTATSLIERLHKANFVERIQDETDRRVVKIKLTQFGQEILNKAIAQKMSRGMFLLDKISEDDKKTLKRIFSETLQKVEQLKDNERTS